jgi:hypothetical protein
MPSANYYNLKFINQYLNYLRKLRVWQVLIVMLVMAAITPRAIANPLDGYCLSEVGQRPEAKSNSPTDEPPEVAFEVEGELFRVVAQSSHLLLMRDKETTPIARVDALQYEYGKINTLVLVQNDWIWIDGDETDYIASLNQEKKLPTLGTPTELPELYVEPCSFWQRFWLKCRLQGGVYSPTLERVFISERLSPYLLGTS